MPYAFKYPKLKKARTTIPQWSPDSHHLPLYLTAEMKTIHNQQPTAYMCGESQ